jgi:hypothetical protein
LSTPSSTSIPDWTWPRLGAGRTLGALEAASFIEWRYYAILSPAFHGIVGLALVNPEQHFAAVAEGGLLLIVAGVLGRPSADALPADAATLCWMHLFQTDACAFDDPTPGSLTASDADCCIALTHNGPASARIRIESGTGLRLDLEHTGLAGAALPPADGTDLGDAVLGRWLGANWRVDCPSPVAMTSGRLELEAGFVDRLPARPGEAPSFASPALKARVAAGDAHFAWRDASGYYEHSWGVRPLPLHGWDFLFVPDAERGQSAVLQTYRGSRALRYLDLCWRQDGEPRQHRFGADQLTLTWADSVADPLLGVRRPRVRRIEAAAHGLRFELTGHVLGQIPLVRHRRLAVRHFFISEEIGIADWTLTDDDGRVLAAVEQQPCGGELAHFRLRAPHP